MQPNVRDPFAVQVGVRVKAAREAKKLTQENLSNNLGFKDRQTLAAIEAGIRKVSAEELMRFMDVLERDLDFFTDPFRLVAEGHFSFRAHGLGDNGLEAFEEKAGCWIAFWRDQGRRQGIASNPLRPKLALNENSTFEEAQAAGEALWTNWNLGDVPAMRLIETAEKQLDLLVLHVDAPDGISGAACQVSGADSILINRNDLEGRRNFDLAHEIFHVLTWDALPPQRVDRLHPKSYKDKHTERLADYFAGALLMPRAVLDPLWQAKDAKGLDLATWLAATAGKLQVSEDALVVRLAILGFLSEADRPKPKGLPPKGTANEAIPPLFSRRFMERAGRAIERGDVSVKRLVSILAIKGTGELKQLFAVHGLKVPFDM